MLEENYFYAAVRYVETNPVKARLVLKAEDYSWSSARARVFGYKDDILSDYFLTKEILDWSGFLRSADEEDLSDKTLETHLNTGRPFGSPDFIGRLEEITGFFLGKTKPGPKLKVQAMN